MNKPDDRELPLVRQCAWCKELLDEFSRDIINTRKRTEYVISHGICDCCSEKIN